MKNILIIIMFLNLMIFAYDLTADIPEYEKLLTELELSKDDTLKVEKINKALCYFYPGSEKVFEIANEEFYDSIYPIWRNDSLKVEKIIELLAKYPETNWRRTMYQYFTYSLNNLNKKTKLMIALSEFRKSFPNDYLPYYLSARYHNLQNVVPKEAIEYSLKAHELSYKYPKLAFYPLEEWDLERRSAPVKTAVLAAKLYYEQDQFEKAENILKDIINENELGIDDETTLAGCFYWLAKIQNELDRKKDAVQNAIQALILGDSRNFYTPKADSLLRRIIAHKDISEEEYIDFIHKQVKYDGVVFEDITSDSGLQNVRAGRVSWGDYNSDGYQDILLDGRRLFRNFKGNRFVEVSQAVFPDTIRANGALWGDFDNDGDIDIVTKDPESIWINKMGKFTKMSSPNSIKDNGVSTEGIGIGDINKDGFLDVYFANYEKNYVYEEDQLFRGIGNGEFYNVTQRADILPKDEENRAGRGVNMCDFDLDGDLDIYVSNYRLTDNFLWENEGAGHFNNAAEKFGIAGDEIDGWWGHTIGSEWADFDNDGDFDLITCNLAHPRYIDFSNKTRLYRNDNGKFINVRKTAGIKYEETHSEPSWADFDNDGDLDLYITSVYAGRRSFLYMNEGIGKFKDETYLAGVRHFNGWGAACADFDNDGDVDLLVAGGKIQLFKNTTKDKKWLEVQVQGKNHVDAIGTRLILSNNETSQMREIQGGKGTTNQHSFIQHFGLNDMQPPFNLEVFFTDGTKKKILVNEINKKIVIMQ